MKIGNKNFNINERTFIMGILNITPDSFSDGGQFYDVEKAILHAKEMVTEGADIIDVGGESTRPGHKIVTEEEELNRVAPLIRQLAKEIDVPISIDTSKAAVAKAAIEAGASMVNDVWGFKLDKEMANVVAKYEVPCCIMHNRDNKDYTNLMDDVISDVNESIKLALNAGVNKSNIIIDPGIGFAKTYEDNLEVMNNLERLKVLGYPILLGTSRKSIVGLTLDLPVTERLEGTIATNVIGIMKGCDFIRVHDVKANLMAAKMADAIIRKWGEVWIK